MEKKFLVAVSKAARRQFEGDGWPPSCIGYRYQPKSPKKHVK